MGYSHEIILPNEDLSFKMFLFEGKNGNYVRGKHWHRSIEIFAIFEGSLRFFLNEEEIPFSKLQRSAFDFFAKAECNSCDSDSTCRF